MRAAIFAWSVGGVILLCGSAAARLGARGLSAWAEANPAQRGVALAWMAWMMVSAAWPGFHRQFAPRVAVRSARLSGEAPSPWALAGPLVAVGLLRATSRRRATSAGLIAGILGLSALLARAPEPWRGLLDLGVAAALSSGVGSLLWFAGLTAAGRAPPVADDWA